MFEYVPPFLMGLVLSLALTPISRRLAFRVGAIDQPGERRIHTLATARLGGPAILIAIALALTIVAMFGRIGVASVHLQWRRLAWAGLGALMVTIVGGVDDIRSLPPRSKLFIEIIAASLAVYGGCRIELPGNHLALLSLPVSVFFIVSVVNAINLVDGLDGLAVGLCLIIGVTLSVLCRLDGQQPLMMAAACGAMAGFLRYNFHPARMFLGDSGALLLGFIVAIGAISAMHPEAGPSTTIAPLIAVGLPLTELILTVTRRLLRAIRVEGRDEVTAHYRFCRARPTLFSADRDHIHHRLLASGISHRMAVLILYAAAAGIGSAALLIAARPDIAPIEILLAVIVGSVIAVRALGYRELMPLRSGLWLPMLEACALSGTAFWMIADSIAILSSLGLALLIRWGWNDAQSHLPLTSLPLITGIQIAVFWMSGLYRRQWHRAGLEDAIAVLRTVVAAVAIAATMAMAARWTDGIDFAGIVLDAYLLATMVLGMRLSFRIAEHRFQRELREERQVAFEIAWSPPASHPNSEIVAQPNSSIAVSEETARETLIDIADAPQ